MNLNMCWVLVILAQTYCLAWAQCLKSDSLCQCAYNLTHNWTITCTYSTVSFNFGEMLGELRSMNESFDTIFIVRHNIPVISLESVRGMQIRNLILSTNLIESISPEFFDPRIETLDIDFNKLNDSLQLVGLPNLKYLYLGWNRLTRVSAGMFRETRALEFLGLRTNRITTIDPGAFDDLKLLRELYLTNNQIKDINSGQFRQLSSLSILELGQNYLETIRADQLTGLENLNDLFLNDNLIISIANNTFAHMKSLRSLNLSGLRIRSVEAEQFNGLHNLTHLNLSDNYIGQISNGTFKHLSNIAFIDMVYNVFDNPCLTLYPFDGLPVKWISFKSNFVKKISTDCFKGNSIITQIDLGDNYISKIESFAFRGLENSLEELNIEFNKIQNIATNSFKGLGALRYLKLSRNQISGIGIRAFADLVSLEELYLDNNCLHTLYPNMFVNLTNLVVLRVDNNLLKKIDLYMFRGSVRLRDLILSDNRLMEVDETGSIGQGLSNLRLLDLRNNSFAGLTFGRRMKFSNLEEWKVAGNSDIRSLDLVDKISLKSLDLSRTNLTSVDSLDVLFNSNKLESLNLSKSNQVANIIGPYLPASLKQLDLSYVSNLNIETFFGSTNRSIKRLFLKGMNLSGSLSSLVTRFPNISLLDISENRQLELTEINRSLSLLSSIQIIYLQNLNINSLDNLNWRSLSSLRELYLDENKIERLQRVHFVGIQDLTSLYLSRNRISYIENGTMTMLVKLLSLDLSNNLLKELEPFYNSLHVMNLCNNLLTHLYPYDVYYIETLDLSGNFLTGVTDLMTRITIYMSLANNNMTKVSNESFLNVWSLERLFLNNNSIESIEPNAFKKLITLTRLDLSQNKLKVVTDFCLSGLISLTKLNLSNNRIETIRQNAFIDLYNIFRIDLSGNNIKFLHDGSFSTNNLLTHLIINGNKQLTRITNNTLLGLSAWLEHFEFDSNLVDNYTNYAIMMASIPCRMFERKILETQFYDSIDFIYFKESAYTKAECEQIVTFAWIKLKLNLFTDQLVNKFLDDCQKSFNEHVIQTIDQQLPLKKSVVIKFGK